MKNRKLTSMLLMVVMVLSFVSVSSGSSVLVENLSNLSQPNELAYNTSPVVIEAVDNDLGIQTTALPSVQGFWTDLVDTEHVANDGSGVYVAVLDTGLLSNWQNIFSQATIRDDLGIGFSHDVTYNSLTDSIEFGPLRSDRGFITDKASGHGTHVTSTIVGYNVYDSFWVEGVAPGVQIIPVLALDAWSVDTPMGEVQISGGTYAMIAAGIMYVADLAATLDGPVVINMSLGGSAPSSLLYSAIQYAISQGVIIVASAGNEGEAGLGFPGAFPEVITAAAAGWTTMFAHGWSADAPEAHDLHKSDELGNNNQLYLEDFSSRPNKDLGQKTQDLDVAAPGAWVLGPYRPEFSSADAFGFYYLSGTSMAAPHVTGIAALVLQSFPDLNQGEMESILKLAARGTPLPASDAIVYFPYTADGYYTASWNGGDYGAGFLTAYNALSTASIHA